MRKAPCHRRELLHEMTTSGFPKVTLPARMSQGPERERGLSHLLQLGVSSSVWRRHHGKSPSVPYYPRQRQYTG